jgi:prophage regulatory protein
MKFLRLKKVTEKTGLSRSTIYRLEAAGNFPKRVRLSLGAVAWHESQVDVWMAERANAS